MSPRLRCCAVFLSAIVAVVFAVQPLRAAERVRIVTFNCEILAAPREYLTISKYRWDHARRGQFERIASVIETLEPDVINLVEVTSKASVDLLIEILHQKGLTEYRGYHIDGRDNFMKLDVAFITKHEPDLIDGEAIRLMYSDRGDMTWREAYTFAREDGEIGSGETGLDRHAVYFIPIAGHKLGFLGLHLKSNPDSDSANGRRNGEAEVARRIVLNEIVARGYTPIVLGDINDYDPDVPDADDTRETRTEVLRNLKDYDLKSEGAELVNAAEKIVRKEDRYTSHWDRNENGVDDPYDVKTMIDHILLHKSLLPHVKRTFIAHTQDARTSDHFPVVVDLALPEGAAK